MEYPEVGKIVRVRKRIYQIVDIDEFLPSPTSAVHFLITLEDIESGEKLKILHRAEEPIELNIKILPPGDVVEIVKMDQERSEIFDAFVTAVRWSTNSIFDTEIVKAPFYSSAKLYTFQLDPLIRALSMPRISLLIADDVGLGKTIEAGMIIQELILRGRISRVIIVCPASLQEQWRREMLEKFSLEFKIMNLKEISKLRKEYGVNVNPWNIYPRVITSIDFIKQEHHLEAFEDAAVDWDLLVVDEAHNVMPKPLKEYYRDSDRSKAIRRISRKVKHRIFLTATPHVGKTEAFTAFLEMLDPIHFTRGKSELSASEKERLREIMVRRLKRDIEIFGDKAFKERYVESIRVKTSNVERKLLELLEKYADVLRSSVVYRSLKENQRHAVDFGLIIMKKRLLSSVYAFFRTLERKIEKDEEISEKIIDYTLRRLFSDYDNDLEKDADEKELLKETTKLVPSEARKILDEMFKIASIAKDEEDPKLKKIYEFIDEKLISDGEWSEEKLIIFTEYKDTMDYITVKLRKRYGESRVINLYGGMGPEERERIKTEFESPPDKSDARILVATDAASEGINLQSYCRYMIHYEIPWSPIKLEQRNGRIHRMGQERDVYIYHFKYEDSVDHEILWLMVQKVETIRRDIESMNEILSKDVFEMERRIFEKDIEAVEKMFGKAEVESVKEGIEVLKETKKKVALSIEEARKRYKIFPNEKRKVFETALRLQGGKIEKYSVKGDAYYVGKLPKSWKDLEELVVREGRYVPISFDDPKMKSDLVFLHLGHPLMKRAIQFFKSQIWEISPLLRKFSVVETVDIDNILLRIFCRATVTDNKLFKVSDDVLQVDILMTDQGPILGDDMGELSVIRDADECVVRKIRNIILRYAVDIKKEIDEKARDYLREVEEIWEKRKEEEIERYRHIMSVRLAEIDKSLEQLERRLKKLQKEKDQQQLLFDEGYGRTISDEIEQIREDMNYLKRRKEDLKIEVEEIIGDLKERHIKETSAVIPFAVKVFVPKGVVGCS